MNYYNEIKNELINNEINKQVNNYSINRSDLNTYYNVGKMLSEAGKHYWEGIIKEYSKRLTEELADNIFRIAQTDAKLKRDKLDNEYTANFVHYEVGNKK